MKRKRIAIFLLGGTISTFRDVQTGGTFSFEKKSELLRFLPDLEKDVDIEIYSNITTKKFFFDIQDWEKAHEFLQQKANKFDGFVILQETDTVLMGASLFGILNADLKIPVIFTASAIPFGAQIGGKIAERNVSAAVEFAASDLGETAICTHKKLIRAVRGKRRNVEDPSPFFQDR